MRIPTKDRVAKCRAKQKRIELLFGTDEYEKIKKAAGGQPIARYIKTTVRKEIEQKDRSL